MKSVTRFDRYNRFNVNIANWKREKPDYAVVLSHIGGRWVTFFGAMPAEKVVDDTYRVVPKDPDLTPFWGIPCEHLTILADELYKALVKVKHRIDDLPKLEFGDS